MINLKELNETSKSTNATNARSSTKFNKTIARGTSETSLSVAEKGYNDNLSSA